MVAEKTTLKAEDLRIDNWVEFIDFPSRHYTKITIDKLKTILDHPVMHTWQPIPLTPEILKKAGFVKTEAENFKKGGHSTMGIDWAFYFNGKEVVLSYSGYHYTLLEGVGIKHLHQLQNLYFALTGEELEIGL